MQRLKTSLLLAPLAILALLTYSPTPAQEAPKPEVKEEAKPVLLTEDEIKLWQAWIRGDLEVCYAQAATMLEREPVTNESLRSVLILQGIVARELGWNEAYLDQLGQYIFGIDEPEQERLVRWEFIQCLTRLGRTAEVADSVNRLGFVTDWWVCGPFPNDRGQGFEDTLAPEHELSLDSELVGKDGQPIAWRQLPAKPIDGSVDLAALVRPNTEACAYLLTALWCDEEDPTAKYYMSGTGDQWLWEVRKTAGLEAGILPHDELIRSESERDFGFDQDAAIGPRPLRKGWNILLMKSGHSDGEWRTSVRIDTHTSWRHATAEELRAALLATDREPRPPQESFSFGPGAGPLTLLRTAMREMLAPRLDRTSTMPRRDLEKVLAVLADKKAGPAETAIVKYIAAWANRSNAEYAAGKEENRRRELLKQCLELDPLAARAALELSQYYTTVSGNPALADEYAQMAVKARPDWTEARIYASRVVAMKGLDIEVERELAKLLQEKPDDANVLRFSAYYAGLRRDYKLSNDLFAKALKADFSDTYSRSRLLERAAARGDLTTALKLANETRQLDPFDTEATAILADLFLYDEKYSLAERELNNALEICPRDDTLLEKLGRVYSAWADADPTRPELHAKSLETYQAALDANPKREDIERYLEFLEGGQPQFEAGFQEDITERIQAALEKPVDGDNPYEVVYRDEIVVVNEDGTTAQYIQEAYRVTNDNGRDWLQQLSVPAYAEQQGRCVEARVWRADGEIEEGRRSRFAASFPPLEIGDVVHVRFRVTDREQSFFGDFYGARKAFSDYVPVHEVRFLWVLPKGRTFHEYRAGGAPDRTIGAEAGRTVWSYRAKNLPKLHDEPLAPPLHQRSATVQISTYANWKDFGRWYYNLIKKQMEPTPEMTAKVAELTKGLTTEKDKARAIYNWVVTDVRYNADWHFGVHGYKPFSAGAVFARCIGDCKDKAILICTMLKIAGVTAYPVIINLDNFRGEEDITLPMPDHFNHAIAHIEYSDGSSQFVDGTTTYNGIDELSSADRGANVIVVRPDGGERVQIPWGDPADDSEKDEIDAEFAGNGTLRLKVTRTAKGDSAAGLRMQFEREGDRKRQLELEWSEFYPGAKVSGIEVNDLANIDLPPVIKFTVELANAYSTKDGAIELKVALDPREWTQTEFASLTARKTDLLTPAPFERSSIVRFTLPVGYAIERKPADLLIDHANVRLELKTESKDGVLTVTRSYRMVGGVVKPADYPEFRGKLSEFDSAETATIKLKK
jgi:hypothetical protein